MMAEHVEGKTAKPGCVHQPPSMMTQEALTLHLVSTSLLRVVESLQQLELLLLLTLSLQQPSYSQ
jgi:hypothetical protein